MPPLRQRLPLEHSSRSDWRSRHPGTLVLSRDTDYRRDYSRSPYPGYAGNPAVWLALSRRDERLPAKAWVPGLEIDGRCRAYPFEELAKQPHVIDRIAAWRMDRWVKASGKRRLLRP